MAYIGTAVVGDKMACYRVGGLLVAEEELGKDRPDQKGVFFKDRDVAETWATFKNLNVTEDVLTNVDTINYLNGPRARQDALEYMLRVGVFDDDATARAKSANRPYLITREDVLAGRVKL